MLTPSSCQPHHQVISWKAQQFGSAIVILTTMCSFIDAPHNFNNSWFLHHKKFPISHWFLIAFFSCSKLPPQRGPGTTWYYTTYDYSSCCTTKHIQLCGNVMYCIVVLYYAKLTSNYLHLHTQYWHIYSTWLQCDNIKTHLYSNNMLQELSMWCRASLLCVDLWLPHVCCRKMATTKQRWLGGQSRLINIQNSAAIRPKSCQYHQKPQNIGCPESNLRPFTSRLTLKNW